MKHLFLSLFLLATCTLSHAQTDAVTGASYQARPAKKTAKKTEAEPKEQPAAARQRVRLETSMGDIVVELYNETPLHRDNFIKLVKAGYYDGILWHRVIKNFMIQAGDSTTRHAQPGASVGEYDLGYTLPAEICFPQFFHKRGVLAAAREGDSVNPERRSSAAQFYIVWGDTFGTMGIADMQEKLDKRTGGTVKLTDEIKKVYRDLGGSPHLDGQYTVYGEVVEGLDNVYKIDCVETDDYDRPIDDVRIIKATLVE